MKTQLLRSSAVLCICAMVCSVLLAITSDGQVAKQEQADERVDVAQLKARIEQMEGQITGMKKEIDELKNLLQVRAIAVPTTPGDPKMRIPRSWSRREFNGMTYYLVPLDKSAADRSDRSKR